MVKSLFSFRIDDNEIEFIKKIASKQYISPSTLIRVWIMERIDKERELAQMQGSSK